MASNGYGAVPNNARLDDNSDEEQQLLLTNNNKKSQSARWRERMTKDVRRDWADLILLACYIITGMLDSASISTWGSFVSMQTGSSLTNLTIAIHIC